MKTDHLKYLRCPKTKNDLYLKNETIENGRIKEGILYERSSNNEYPIVNFIPRFVPAENYASGFGFQWNLHNKTQFDEYSQINVSEKRFFDETKWERNLKEEIILEVGSGSGRFTSQAASTGAVVVSFDYSSAVEANYKSNGQGENVLIVQASVYEMPFPKNYFDKVLCIGVLQHTPDPKKSFLTIAEYLKSHGKIVTDSYRKSFIKYYSNPKYLVRVFTKGGNAELLYKRIVNWVNFMWPFAKLVRKIDPRISHRFCVVDHSRLLPNAPDSLIKEWAYLDTFDMLAPMYDFPQTIRTYKRWHLEAGLENIEVHPGHNGIEARATKK